MPTKKIDFLGIGVQKAATSWLWTNLREHTDIWLAPRKELHYFDRSLKYPSPSHLSSDNKFKRFLGREKHNKRFRKLFYIELGVAIKCKDWKKAHWLLRYFLGTNNDNWYLSLFNSGKGKLKGEITPSYSILNPDQVKHIRNLFPKIKMILILRNPIERAWSNIRFFWESENFNTDNNLDKIKKFIDSPSQSLRGNYYRTLNIWKSCFPEDQIYIAFYEDIKKNPQELLNNIFNFLDVDSRLLHKNKTPNKKIHVSKKIKMPEEIKYYLANKYHKELQKTVPLIGSYSLNWLEETEKILNNDFNQ